MKSYKWFAAALAVVCLSCSFTGCGSNTATTEETSEVVVDTATKEVMQNDYRGGVVRMQALQDEVLSLVEDMKSNNITVRTDNPNSYWTADGYQDFVTNFLSIPIITDTQYFNEEETDWETIVNTTLTSANSFTVADSDGAYTSAFSSIGFTRNEKDDYSITGVTGNIAGNSLYQGSFNYRILYDCDKDWCKAYKTLTLTADMPEVTAEMFEFARIDNDTFAIQTSKERLVVVLQPVEEDTDIREREIKEFYYSKLTVDGVRTTFEPYETLPEYDEITGAYVSANASKNTLYASTYGSTINGKGDLSFYYGKNDSIFYNDMSSIGSDWVFEDKGLQQAIVYKDGALVVTTYNKLSENYERFVYKLAGTTDATVAEIEAMVEIKDLVGVQQVETEEEADFIEYDGKKLYPIYEGDELIGYSEINGTVLYTPEMIESGATIVSDDDTAGEESVEAESGGEGSETANTEEATSEEQPVTEEEVLETVATPEP
jgi:hypothetical protein